jgi:hypothetical protein
MTAIAIDKPRSRAMVATALPISSEASEPTPNFRPQPE